MISASDVSGRRLFARFRPPDALLDGPDAPLPPVQALFGPLAGRLAQAGFWTLESEIPWLQTFRQLQEYLVSDNYKVFHNAKFDIPMLESIGFVVNWNNVHDTMIIARLVMPDAMSVGLKPLSKLLLKADYHEEDRVRTWRRSHGNPSFDQVPEQILKDYAMVDAVYTMALFLGLAPKLPDVPLYNQEMRLVKIVAGMEQRGMLCDLDYAKEQLEYCNKMKAELQTNMDGLNGGSINLNSPQQLNILLFEKLRLQDSLSVEDLRRFRSILKTPKGQYSTKREALRVYNHHAVRWIMEYRMFNKMGNTYFKKFLEVADGRGIIHPSFWQAGPRTGRFSSSDPSFQTIPSVTSGRLLDFDRSRLPDVRRCFVPREGYRMYAPDFSQIELRIASWYGDEAIMQDAFRHGRDIHDETTKAIFPDDWMSENDPGKVDKPKRTFCKMVNFGVLYGMGLGKLSADLGVPMERARTFLDRYFATYPGLKRLMEQCQSHIITQGYVQSVFGRRFRAPVKLAYKGLNYLIQGTAADVMKQTLIRVDDLFHEMGLRAYLLNTVHDEIIFEIWEEDDTEEFHKELKRVMEDWPLFDPVPITVNCKKIVGYWGNHEEVW